MIQYLLSPQIIPAKPAAQDAAKPLIWYLRDLNMNSDVGFSVENPDIYYGQGIYDYALVPNKLKVEDISGSDPSITKTYHGDGGIQISSMFKKAWRSMRTTLGVLVGC
jgi:uncharacterized membrane protein (UPF0182 family)